MIVVRKCTNSERRRPPTAAAAAVARYVRRRGSRSEFFQCRGRNTAASPRSSSSTSATKTTTTPSCSTLPTPTTTTTDPKPRDRNPRCAEPVHGALVRTRIYALLLRAVLLMLMLERERR